MTLDEREENLYERVRKIVEIYPQLLEHIEELSRSVCKKCRKKTNIAHSIDYICKQFGYTGK
jgi:hypothetical protein